MAKRPGCLFHTLIFATDEITEEFTAIVEQETREIIGDIFEKEYLARRVIVGTMPHLNCIFEELGIHHEEHKVLAKVLKSIKNKEKKVTLKGTTVVVEAKKRKGAVKGKEISKNQKVGAASVVASTSYAEEVAKSMPIVSVIVAASAEAYRSKASNACRDEDLMGSALDGLNGAPTLGASDMAPMPTVLSKDSSSSKDDDAEVGSSLASGREETTSKGHVRSTKTSHLEESEAESEEHLPPAQP